MFDTKAFERAKFEPRTREVHVPRLVEFFRDGSEPIFVVRGLSGQELGQVEADLQASKSYEDLIAALAEKKGKEIAAHLREHLGYGEEVPKQTARAIYSLVHGIVEPALSREAIIKLCTHFPADFYAMYRVVEELSGAGSTMGKPKPSGKTPESKQPAPSETPGGDSSTN